MAKTFKDIMRERIKNHLLNGDLKAVQGAKDFLNYTDEKFGQLIAPLLKPAEQSPIEQSPIEQPPAYYEGTVLIQPSGYAIVDANNTTLHEGGVSEYRTLNFTHGDHIRFKKDGKFLSEITRLYNAVETGDLKPINLFDHALIEINYKTGELYVEKNINGQTLAEAGSKIKTFYLRQLTDSKQLKNGDIIDLFIKDNGQPHPHWVHRYDYQDIKTPKIPKQAPKKASIKSNKPKSNLDFDLTDKIIAVIGLPQNVRPNIIKSFTDEKHVKDLRIVDHDINYQTFTTKCDQALKNADAVIIAKTGLNHAMSGYLIDHLKKENIPFAYANQPSFARIEMAAYRAINHLAIDEISYNGDYPIYENNH